MSLNDRDVLFALFRSAVLNEEFCFETAREIDAEMLKRLYIISKKHDVAHLVTAGLDRADIDISLRKSEICERLSIEAISAFSRCENQDFELKRICDAFEKAEIDYIPLKGAVLRELYPQRWLRTSCDIDILVREEEIERAVKVLTEALGYRAESCKNYHDISLFSESGVHIELHFNIKENVSILDSVLDRVWEYAEDRVGCRYSLTKEFFVYYHIAHTAYHFTRGGCGIRPFIDLFLLIKAGYDSEKVEDICRASGIHQFYKYSLKLANVWLAGASHDDVSKGMEDYIVSSGAYGTQEARVAFGQYAKGGKSGYFRSRVFLPYDRLKQRYPSLKSRVKAPLYQMRRWIDTVRAKRLSSSLKELEVNSKVDLKTADRASFLIKSLELHDLIK